MARSRSGGTSGLLSGKLGDVIYSITRNADGSFRQQVSMNPEERENPNTDEQARARLTMATIERAMFTLKPLMGTGFEGVDRGTVSVSKFSEVNYNFYKESIKDAWDLDMPQYVRIDVPKKGQSVPRDGEFIISQGSLKEHLGLSGSHSSGSRPRFNYMCVPLNNYHTLKEVLHESRLDIGDQLACIQFGIGTRATYSFIVWWTMWTEAVLPPTTIIDESNWDRILKFNSNVPITPYYDSNTKWVCVRSATLENYGLTGWGTVGWRRRRDDKGKIRYSNAKMQTTYLDPWSRMGWQDIPDVKNSWLNSI